jgi:hypothetical protein
MGMLAAGSELVAIVIVAIAVAIVVGFVVWKVCAVAKAAKTKGTPDDKLKATGEAMFGGGKAYGKGYDAGKQAGEKFAAWIKSKRKK